MNLGPAKYVVPTGIKGERIERLCLVLELLGDGYASVQVYNRPTADVMVGGEDPVEVIYRVPIAFHEGAGAWLEPLDDANVSNRHGVDGGVSLGHGEARSRRNRAPAT